MQVVEKTHHIEVRITGAGADTIAALIKERMPDAIITDEANEVMEWKTSALAAEIRAKKTPGKLVRAYRERAGLSLVQLARIVGTKYPNISMIENERREIGLAMAQKLGDALGVNYTKFLPDGSCSAFVKGRTKE